MGYAIEDSIKPVIELRINGMVMATSPIILFDGVCNLCKGTVIFVIKRDKCKLFKFASLQSDVGQQLLSRYGIAKETRLDSMVLIKSDKAYRYSSAALHVAKELSGIWPLCFGLVIIPAPIRDVVYNFIGKHRYHWFGKMEQCWLPDLDVKDRFLG